MTNAASNNHIDAYTRLTDGSPESSGSFAAGGNGSGGTLPDIESMAPLFERVFGVGKVLSRPPWRRKDRHKRRSCEATGLAAAGIVPYPGVRIVIPLSPPHEIGQGGALTPIDGTIVGSNPSGSTNLDIAISSDGKFLFSLNGEVGTVGVFAIRSDGSLEELTQASGLPPAAGFNGIAAL